MTEDRDYTFFEIAELRRQLRMGALLAQTVATQRGYRINPRLAQAIEARSGQTEGLMRHDLPTTEDKQMTQDIAGELLAALKGAVGALEFSRDYHSDLGNEDQAFAQDRLDAALRAIASAEGK